MYNANKLIIKSIIFERATYNNIKRCVRRNFMKTFKPMTIIFIGAIIAVIGGLLTAYGTLKQNKSSSKRMMSIQSKTDEINTKSEKQLEEIASLKNQNDFLQSTIDSLNMKADQQVKTIIELSKQNSELSIQLAKSTQNLNDNITGGNSFCEIQINPQTIDSSIIYIIHHGSSTLFDVTFRITDLELFKKETNFFHTGDLKSQFSFNIGNLNPNTAIEVGTINRNMTGLKQFNIQIAARNGSFSQVLKLYKTETYWLKATVVKEFISRKVIYKKIDSDFPKEHLDF